MRSLPLIALCALALAGPFAEARSHSSSHSSHSTHSRSHHYSAHHGSSHRASGVARDSHGHIKRSAKAKDNFRHSHPCPSTGKTRGACPGYIIDHRQALKHGGADDPSNMQWQTKEAAKAKDKVE
jgi:hypothetical protein